jgi:twitching motility protein PilT
MDKINLASLLYILSNKKGASDLHLNVGDYPAIRINGKIKRITDFDILNNSKLTEILHSILSEKQKIELEETRELDFSYETTFKVNGVLNTVRFRANYYFERQNIAAVFRLIPTTVPTIEELGMPPILKKIMEKPRGLVLITGPTGSGKSTTLAAMIDYYNKNENGHILTIEDPIEFVHKPYKCIISQREVRRDTLDFKNALRAALREDPDLILVGELRDKETMEIALTAAETGHLVLGTLHTNSAMQTINRIINVFPPEEQAQIRTQLSLTLVSVISQTLIPLKNGKGRIAVQEILINTPAISNLIRENKIEQIYSNMQTSVQLGMQTMNQVLVKLLREDIISAKDALRYTNNIKELKDILNI